MMVGCADPSEDEAVQTDVVLGTQTRIFGGKIDDGAKAISSVVALKVTRGAKHELCSGALIAPNVILTARHCVGNTITETVACDENGRSTNGPHVDGNMPASAITVYTGASPQFTTEPNAIGKTIVSPDSDSLCDNDIALVVLDREIADVEPLAVRIGSKVGVVSGETVRSVGYGQNDMKKPLGTRLRKEGVNVLAMGKGISQSKTALGMHEFEVGKSICEGDSGGPALSEETGAVIGVVSRGGNCDQDYGHIYTATASWNDLFERTFKLAGGAPIVETGMPEGPQTAAHPVAVRDPAPTAPAAGAEPAPKAGGCTMAPLGSSSSSGGGLGVVGLVAAALVIAARRRRG